MDANAIAAIASLTGAVASVAGAIITVWWPWRNRPQASWFVRKFEGSETPLSLYGIPDFTTHDGLHNPDAVLEVLNDGDGPAFAVTFSEENCEVRMLKINEQQGTVSEIFQIHMVRAGESFIVLFWGKEESTGVSFSVHWTLQPTSRQKRVYHTFALKGTIERQPWKPIPEKSREGANLTWYRLAHSKPAQWIRRHLQSLVRRLHGRGNQEHRG